MKSTTPPIGHKLAPFLLWLEGKQFTEKEAEALCQCLMTLAIKVRMRVKDTQNQVASGSNS